MAFVEHRREVVVRRTPMSSARRKSAAHILEGLKIALDNLDAVIALIRRSQSPDVARIGLMQEFALSELQANAILEMRLQRLTQLERNKLIEEYRRGTEADRASALDPGQRSAGSYDHQR